jgi:arginase family enzyme
VVLGAPVRRGSISGGDFHLAPTAIRSALQRYTTYDVEIGVDVRRIEIDDRGDLPLADDHPDAATPILELRVKEAVGLDGVALILGGDNSITRGGVRGLWKSARVNLSDEESLEDLTIGPPRLERIGLLTLDAHHDLRDLDGGLTNGNPIRALIEDGLPGANIAQIGIQSFANSKAYADIARDAGIHAVTAEQARSGGIEPVVREALAKLEQVTDAIYVDLDVDVLDRAFAPACPGSRPGGLTPMEVQQAARLCGAHPKVRAIDIVEVDPTRDVAEATVMAAASFVLSFAAGLAARRSS